MGEIGLDPIPLDRCGNSWNGAIINFRTNPAGKAHPFCGSERRITIEVGQTYSGWGTTTLISLSRRESGISCYFKAASVLCSVDQQINLVAHTHILASSLQWICRVALGVAKEIS